MIAEYDRHAQRFWISSLLTNRIIWHSMRQAARVHAAERVVRMLFSIQFLRFIASFGVLLHHSSDGLYGLTNVFAAGVDIFFVISGFVISISTKDDESAGYFIAKRLVRVYPLYWLCTLFFIGFKYIFWSDIPNAMYLIKSMLLMPDLGKQWVPIYFPAWTLVYEVAFYILCSVMVAVSGQYFRTPCIFMLVVLSSTQIPSSVPGIHLSSQILIEFVFGILIAQGLPFLRSRHHYIGITAIVIAIFLFTVDFTRYGVIRSIGWGVPAALLVSGSIVLENIKLFNFRISKLLGESSYSLYLTHLTVISWIEEFEKRHGVYIKKDPLRCLPLFILTSIVVAVAVHIMLERPMLGLLRRKLLPKRRTQLTMISSQ